MTGIKDKPDIENGATNVCDGEPRAGFFLNSRPNPSPNVSN